MISTELVLATAMQHRQVASALSGIITHELAIPNPFQLEVGKFLVKFLAEKDRLPQQGDWSLWLGTLQETQRMGCSQVLSSIAIQQIQGYTPEYIVEVSEPHFRQVAASTALSRINGLGRAVTPDVLTTVAEEIQKIRVISLDLASVKDIDKWLVPDRRHETTIPTGILSVDNQLLGGFEHELVFVMADSGIGKTTFLSNCAVSAAGAGCNVLHISLENFLRSTIRRYYRRIAQVTQAEYHDQVAVKLKLDHWVRFVKGNIHVMYLDAYSVDCEDIRVLADRYAQTFGRLDMVVLDYLDILGPAKAVAHRSEPSQHAHASHRVRGICQANDSAVLSATQATRDAGNRPRLRLSDMGESYGKVKAAGVVLGLMQNEAERRARQGRINTLKIREVGGRGSEYPLYMDLDRQIIIDFKDPRAQRWLAIDPPPLPVENTNGQEPGNLPLP